MGHRQDMEWKVLIDTAENVLLAENEEELENQRAYEVKPRSIVVFIGEKGKRITQKLQITGHPISEDLPGRMFLKQMLITSMFLVRSSRIWIGITLKS